MGHPTLRRLLASAACWTVAAGCLSAQQVDDPVAKARVRFGAVGLTPSISLRNLGIDNNVFNELDDPKRDFTFTVSPQANVWSRAGRARLSGDGRLDLVHFQKYASERSVDGDFGGRIEILANRLTPWASGRYARGRQRVGYEVDLRSRRVSDTVAFGADARMASRTRLGISLQRATTRYDGDALFLGASLQEMLDRTTDTLATQYSQSLTPLTVFVLQAEAIRDRFTFSPDRNADSVRVMAGFSLAPSALISGQVRIGYRKFDPLGGAVKANRGLTANISAGATVANRARLEFGVQRDISYSFEPTYPYYVLTGAKAALTPRLTDHWDVQATLDVERLAYTAFEGSTGLAGRVDSYLNLGAGVGYRLGRDLRLGVNLNNERRRSPVQIRDYTGLRIGSTVTYGR